jgi:electron transport complex protein RnfC
VDVIKTDIKPRSQGCNFGVKLPGRKLTAASPVETAPLPPRVIISLQQNPGTPCQPLVKPGDKVLTGQKIGDTQEFISAPVHASISGEVSDIINIPDATGKQFQAVVIDSDGKDEWVKLNPTNSDEFCNEDILQRIREAGIVGMGGAAFPSHVKLTTGDNEIRTLILNGCECEPYITVDHRTMLEYGDKVLSGLQLIRRLVSPQEIYIAIEDNKPDAILHISKLAAALDSNIKVVPVKTRYPAGAREMLIKTILGRELPLGRRARNIGVLVHNVGTAKAIHEAVVDGKPFIQRIVTVSGAVKQPKNLMVRLGTPMDDLLQYCGGYGGRVQVISGGPMTGTARPDAGLPVNKATCSVLIKEIQPAEELNCIRCGNCIDVCPKRLEPVTLAKYAKAGFYDDCQRYYIDACFNCGCCSYVCPSHIPILHYIRTARMELAKKVNSVTA